MVKEELDLLQHYINEISDITENYSENYSSELYELIEEASALYGSEIPQLQSAYEYAANWSSSLQRESKVILALLRRKMMQETSILKVDKYLLIKEKLSVVPECQKLYSRAISKLEQEQLERNLLDDLRLCLELLLKKFLSNNESLEKQVNHLGQKLIDYNFSKEIRNVFTSTMNYYSKYQNEHIKHNDNFSEYELNYMVDQTTILIELILNLMESGEN